MIIDYMIMSGERKAKPALIPLSFCFFLGMK